MGGVVSEIGAHFDLIDPVYDFRLCDQDGTERQVVPNALGNQRVCIGRSFVVDFSATVLVEGQSLTLGCIPIGDTIAKHEANSAKPVEVAVGGEDRRVILCDLSGGFGSLDLLVANIVLSANN